MRALPILALVTACGAEGPLALEDQATSLTASGVVFSRAEAMAVIDMVDHAPVETLDRVPYVSATKARDLVARRPFARAADPIGALDAVPGVGPSTLAALRDAVFTLWCGDARAVCPGQARLVLNEFAPGRAGFVELVNLGDADAELSGLAIDDAEGGAAPKALSGRLPAGGLAVVRFAGINTASLDRVRLLGASGDVEDEVPNGYEGRSLAGLCFGRAGVGGDWLGGALRCSPGQPNPATD